MSLMAGLSVRPHPYHRQIVLTVDFLLAAAFFWCKAGGRTSIWVGLIPVLTGRCILKSGGIYRGALICDLAICNWGRILLQRL